MQRFIRMLAVIALTTCGALACAAHAQIVDPAMTGTWSGRSLGGQVVLQLSQDGAFRGGIAAPGLDCAFVGQVEAREVSASSPTRFVAASTARLTCLGQRAGAGNDVKFDGTPSGMGFQLVGFAGTLTRIAGLLGAAGNRIVSPDIPGHWEGTSNTGVHASLDLSADGNFAGTVSGQGLEGCTFKARIPPAQAFDNDADSFNGLAVGSMSGCVDATLNKNNAYLTLLGATPLDMTILFMRADESLVFEVQGMTRTATVGAASDTREAKAGMWNSPLGSGWGMSLVTGKTAARTPFVVLYVYNTDKAPTWYVMSSGTWTDDNNFSGDLYATTGTDWRAPSFDSSSVTVKKVGTLMMNFTSDTVGRLTYQINEGSATYVSSSPMVKQGF